MQKLVHLQAWFHWITSGLSLVDRSWAGFKWGWDGYLYFRKAFFTDSSWAAMICIQKNFLFSMKLFHCLHIFRWRGRHLYTEFICCCIVVVLLYCCIVLLQPFQDFNCLSSSKWCQVALRIPRNSILNLEESCRILQNLVESCRILQNLAKS